MTAQELANLGTCGAGSALGFNTDKGCADLLLAAECIWLLSPSLRIAPTQEINETYIKGLQKSGDLVIIQGISSFAENGNDDAVETLEDDTMLLTNEGKYKFLATFAGKGLYYNRALHSIKGHENWRIMVVDKKGDVFLTHNPDTAQQYGFRAGMIQPAKLQPASNTTSTKSGLNFQLLHRYELDEYYQRWAIENLDFDPRLVEPVTQVWIELVNAPADTDTTVTVKLVVDRGRKDVVTGADYTQFLQVIDGATENPTAGDDSVTAGTYPLTVGALSSGEEGTIRLYDNSGNSPVIEITGNGLFKSNVVSFTVT